jgi:DNA-binding beta-propeller fold protein YncE
MRILILALPLLCAVAACAPTQSSVRPDRPYHVVQRFNPGEAGGWDLLAVDAHRLFISRTDRVMVIDTDSGKLLGEIPAAGGVHGIALVPEAKRGFTTNGHANTVTVFDLDTLAVTGEIKVTGDNPDAILYDPASKRVFAFNGHSANASAIDPASLQVVATIALPGKPELAASDGRGRMYVNLEDRNEIAVLDALAGTVLGTWSLAPCEEPTGLALDAQNGRLFAVCSNHEMMVVDAQSGRHVAEVPIGDGPDGAAFDPGTGLAFSSNGGDGTLTVVHEDDAEHFSVIGSVATQKSARTLALDPSSHRVFLAAAEMGERPEPTPDQPHPRAPMTPGTFSILVVGP